MKYYYLFCWETNIDKRTFEVTSDGKLTTEEISIQTSRMASFLKSENQQLFLNIPGGKKYEWIALIDIKVIECQEL